MKTITKGLLIVIVVLFCVAAGCGILSNMYPTPVPKSLPHYVATPSPLSDEQPAVEDENPEVANQPLIGRITTLGKAHDLREQAVVKHTEVQLDLRAAMEKDQATYEQAIAQADVHIQAAEAERNQIIGTLDKPGWVMMALLGVTGLGAYFTGVRTQRPQDYNPDEHQAEIDKVKAETRTATLAELALTTAVAASSKAVAAVPVTGTPA